MPVSRCSPGASQIPEALRSSAFTPAAVCWPSGERLAPPGRGLVLRRHCDRPVRASATARAVVPSPVSRRSRLGGSTSATAPPSVGPASSSGRAAGGTSGHGSRRPRIGSESRSSPIAGPPSETCDPSIYIGKFRGRSPAGSFLKASFTPALDSRARCFSSSGSDPGVVGEPCALTLRGRAAIGLAVRSFRGSSIPPRCLSIGLARGCSAFDQNEPARRYRHLSAAVPAG